VQSIFAQSFEDWELLLVDDGSTDGSLEAVLRITDPRVKVITDGSNRGLPHRLNQISDLARGEFIARMDGDDIMHPDRLSDQLQIMQGHPELDMVGSRAVVINEKNEPIGVVGPEKIDMDPWSFLRKSQFVHPSIMAKAKWLKDNRYSSEFVRAEDHELWIRACRTSVFGQAPRLLLFYRDEQPNNPQKYYATQRSDRRLARTYGNSIAGFWRTALFIVETYAKTWEYAARKAISGKPPRITRNVSPIRGNEADDYFRALGVIMGTQVAGLTVTESVHGV
jgi:glycosyltransferase involved in cell wall biosynthesis